MVLGVELNVDAGSWRDRDTYMPIGRWVKLAHRSAIGGEKENVHNIPTIVMWWVALKRDVFGQSNQEGVSLFSLEMAFFFLSWFDFGWSICYLLMFFICPSCWCQA
jgi:hypothetical protein